MSHFAFFLTALLQTGGTPSTTGYLILGYIVMWFVGAVYVLTLFSRQRNLKQDVELMQQLLKEEKEVE